MELVLIYAPMPPLHSIILIKLQFLVCKVVRIIILKIICQGSVYWLMAVLRATMLIIRQGCAYFYAIAHFSFIGMTLQCSVLINVHSIFMETHQTVQKKFVEQIVRVDGSKITQLGLAYKHALLIPHTTPIFTQENVLINAECS